MKRFIFACLLFPGIGLADIEISNAWIKNLPASVPVRAGYVELHNSSDQKVQIIGAHSEAFASIEMHRTNEQEGVMRMDPVDTIDLQAGDRVMLKPGGLHLMLMMPHAPTKPGDQISITLRFADGTEQSFTAIVKK